MLQWMPTLSTNPRGLKQAASLAVPAKTSKAKIWLLCYPCRVQPLVKLSFFQRCSWSEWCLKHPGSAQRCTPLEQASPGLAALHPCSKLNDQHSLVFWGVSNALPIKAAGTLGPLLPFWTCPCFSLCLWLGSDDLHCEIASQTTEVSPHLWLLVQTLAWATGERQLLADSKLWARSDPMVTHLLHFASV